MRAPLQKGRVINWGCVGPLLGCIAVAALLIAGAITLARHDRYIRPVPSPFHTQTDAALSQELLHCQSIGDAARNDRDCLAAWTENRCRFFGSALSTERGSRP